MRTCPSGSTTHQLTVSDIQSDSPCGVEAETSLAASKLRVMSGCTAAASSLIKLLVKDRELH